VGVCHFSSLRSFGGPVVNTTEWRFGAPGGRLEDTNGCWKALVIVIIVLFCLENNKLKRKYGLVGWLNGAENWGIHCCSSVALYRRYWPGGKRSIRRRWEGKAVLLIVVSRLSLGPAVEMAVFSVGYLTLPYLCCCSKYTAYLA
jgi:hypothetical protein